MLSKPDLQKKVSTVLAAFEEQVVNNERNFVSEPLDDSFDSKSGSYYSDLQDIKPYLSVSPDLIYSCMELIQEVTNRQEISKDELNTLLHPVRKSIASFLLM